MRADGADILSIQVREIAADARVENGAAEDRQGLVVLVDTEASGSLVARLYRAVKLELVVGNDLASTLLLIGQFAILESYDGSLSAFGNALRQALASWNGKVSSRSTNLLQEITLGGCGSIDWADLKGVRKRVDTVLSSNSSHEGSGNDSELHVDDY